jgi:hypothetical protein
MEVKNEIKGICPVCGGNIVSVVLEEKPARPPEFMVTGPGGSRREEEPLHCDRCGVMFAFPTPPVVSDMMKRHRETNAANTTLLRQMVG